MKKLYFISIDDPFEVQGFFNENEEVIHSWWADDAVWRGEYFNYILNSLGYEVTYPYSNLKKKND